MTQCILLSSLHSVKNSRRWEKRKKKDGLLFKCPAPVRKIASSHTMQLTLSVSEMAAADLHFPWLISCKYSGGLGLNSKSNALARELYGPWKGLTSVLGRLVYRFIPWRGTKVPPPWGLLQSFTSLLQQDVEDWCWNVTSGEWQIRM